MTSLARFGTASVIGLFVALGAQARADVIYLNTQTVQVVGDSGSSASENPSTPSPHNRTYSITFGNNTESAADSQAIGADFVSFDESVHADPKLTGQALSSVSMQFEVTAPTNYVLTGDAVLDNGVGQVQAQLSGTNVSAGLSLESTNFNSSYYLYGLIGDVSGTLEPGSVYTLAVSAWVHGAATALDADSNAKIQFSPAPVPLPPAAWLLLSGLLLLVGLKYSRAMTDVVRHAYHRTWRPSPTTQPSLFAASSG
jgi:hypothetical protein